MYTAFLFIDEIQEISRISTIPQRSTQYKWIHVILGVLVHTRRVPTSHKLICQTMLHCRNAHPPIWNARRNNNRKMQILLSFLCQLYIQSVNFFKTLSRYLQYDQIVVSWDQLKFPHCWVHKILSNTFYFFTHLLLFF